MIRLRFFIWILIVIVSIGIVAACVSEPNQNINSTEKIQSDTLPETDPLPHEPYSATEITCGIMAGEIETKEYWFEQMVPGESSIDDLRVLVDLSTKTPEFHGVWAYTSGNVRFVFENGILVHRVEATYKQLGKIILQYGPPEQVVWHIPKTAYHLAKYDTYLLYPDMNAWFETENQVKYFYAETEFEYLTFTTPQLYEESIANFKPNQTDDYQIFAWPCPDSAEP